MSCCDGTLPVGDASSMRGSPTRRRLLALLSHLPIIAVQSEAADQRRAGRLDVVVDADPMPRLFAEFQALLDRHAPATASRRPSSTGSAGRAWCCRVVLIANRAMRLNS